MTDLEKLNKELTQKLQQLEIAHKHCVNFMGKAFIQPRRKTPSFRSGMQADQTFRFAMK